MNREKYSIIGHTGFPFWNPVSPEVFDDWIGQMPLRTESRVLDVGCGRAELLLRILEHHGCHAMGIDSSASAIEHARQSAVRRVSKGTMELKCQPFDVASLHADRFDLVSCVGSIHVAGDLERALRVMSQLTRPGGCLMVGEGYWKREPAPEYLSMLQSSPDTFRTHEGNLNLAQTLSLEIVRSHEASDAEWSRYEDAYATNIRGFVETCPEDPDAEEMKHRIERWRHAYLKWGRHTLGFGLYLLRTPSLPIGTPII